MLVEESLVALGQRRVDPLALGRCVPGRGRGDGPLDGRNPTSTAAPRYRDRVSWPRLCSPHAPICACRASPTWELCSQTMSLARSPWRRWWARRLSTVRHVGVPQVPGGDVGGEHRPVVLLGVGDQARVLLGVELVVLGGEPVAAQVTDRVAMQLQQLLDHAAPAGLADPQADRPSVLLALAAEVLEARVPSRARSGGRGDRSSAGRRSPPRSTYRGCTDRARRTRRRQRGSRLSLCARSQPTKSSTSAVRHPCQIADGAPRLPWAAAPAGWGATDHLLRACVPALQPTATHRALDLRRPEATGCSQAAGAGSPTDLGLRRGGLRSLRAQRSRRTLVATQPGAY